MFRKAICTGLRDWKVVGLLLVCLLIPSKLVRAQEITGAGATLPGAIYQKWFEKYQSQNGVRVDYQPIGSGGGMQRIYERSVDFGASDLSLTDAQMKVAPNIAHIPTLAHAVVMVYNLPSIHTKLRLTGSLIADIYMGKVTRWNDPHIAKINLGVTLPDLAIIPLHQSDGNATTYLLTTYLSEVSPVWNAKVGIGKSVRWPVGLGGKGCAGVGAIVKSNVGSFAYMELTNAEKNAIPIAAIQNRTGTFVYPSDETAGIATESMSLPPDLRGSVVNCPAPKGYPIVGYTYLLVYSNTVSPRVKSLITWMLTVGQRDAVSLGFTPLPPHVRKQALAVVTGFTEDAARPKNLFPHLTSKGSNNLARSEGDKGR